MHHRRATETPLSPSLLFTACPLQCTDHHKPHSLAADFAGPPPHLATGPCLNPAARPLSPVDDGTGSYGRPPAAYVGADDAHKPHPP